MVFCRDAAVWLGRSLLFEIFVSAAIRISFSLVSSHKKKVVLYSCHDVDMASFMGKIPMGWSNSLQISAWLENCGRSHLSGHTDKHSHIFAVKDRPYLEKCV